MLAQLSSLLAKLAASLNPDEAKAKTGKIKTVLSCGSGEGWIPLGRQKETLHFRNLRRGTSEPARRGEASTDGKTTVWVQFDWSPDQKIDGCRWHSVSWRFYRSGLVSLSLELSKEKSGLDIADLVGHRIELRDRSGFVLGVWSAGFQVRRGSEPMAYQASISEDFGPLVLHFEDIAETQTGFWFRI